MRKKLLVCCSILFVLLCAGGVSAYAQEEFKALAPIPGLTAPNPGEGSVIDSNNLANFFNNLYKYLIGIAAILAIIQIIRGGLEISTQDSISKQSAGREHIRDAIFGLVLVLSPVLVFSIINPTILNLSLNLPGLETADSPDQDDDGTQTETDPETECLVTGTEGILQSALCPSESTARDWGTTNCAAGFGLSEIIPVTTSGKSRILCQTNKKFVFVETKVSFFRVWINEIDPLAVTKDNPNNAQEALTFVNTCNAVGRTTCLSDFLGGEVVCDPAPSTDILVENGSGKCYERSLSCQPGKVVGSGYLCESQPEWTAFR